MSGKGELSIILHEDKPYFDVASTLGDTVRVTFLDAPIKAFLGSMRGAAAYKAAANIRASVYMEGSRAVVMFSQDDFTPATLRMRVEGLEDTDHAKVNGTGRSGDTDIAWHLYDGSYVANKNVWRLNMSGADMRIEFSVPQQQEFSFQMMSVSNYIPVPAGRRMPQASVGVYDYIGSAPTQFNFDESLLRPRPLRHGTPVISTVPVWDEDLPQEEKEFYENGKGPDTRHIYFRVVIDQPYNLVSAIFGSANNPTRTIPYLKIWLPDGPDSVGDPVIANLYAVNSDNQDQQTVLYGSYEFKIEDGLDWVDGSAYFSVYLPLHVQVPLPLKLKVETV